MRAVLVLFGVFCTITAQMPLASELAFIAKFHTKAPDLVLLIYDDGSVYQVAAHSEKSRVPPYCTGDAVNVRTLTWFGYDVLPERQSPISRLAPQEVSRVSATFWDSQVQYDVGILPKQDFGTVCYYAVRRDVSGLSEARLVAYESAVHEISPKRSDRKLAYGWLQRAIHDMDDQIR